MTAICPFIRLLETAYWGYLTDLYSYRMDSSEIGFTKDLIYRIADYYNDWPEDEIEVFAMPGELENYRGADIDLFIQDDITFEFRSYKIQAKLLKHTGVYRSLFYRNGTVQADNLITYATKNDAQALYLFYNGKYNANCPTDEPYFGMSIIDAETVRQQFIDKVVNQSPRFDQLFNFMHPFHVLFCDLPSTEIINHNKSSLQLPKPSTKREDIFTKFPYKRITKQSDDVNESNQKDEQFDISSAKKVIKENGLAATRIIVRSDLRTNRLKYLLP